MQTSNEGTKYMLTLATKHLVHLNESLVKVRAATELEVSYDFGKGRYVGKRYVHDQKTVTVVKGAKVVRTFEDGTKYELDGVEVVTSEPGRFEQKRIFVFETEQSSRVNTLLRNIKSVEGDIKFLNLKIIEWKP